MSEVLEQCARLSFYERIERTVTPELVPLLPPRPKPIFKYQPPAAAKAAGADAPPPADADDETTLATALVTKIRTKDSADALETFLQTAAANLSAETQLDVLFHCVLHTGSKSVSHLLSVLERYCVLLRRLSSSPAQQRQLLDAIGSFWPDSNLHQVILLDKLMTYRIVRNDSIVEWLFSSERAQLLIQYVVLSLSQSLSQQTRLNSDQHPFASFSNYTWRILRNTIDKTIARIESLTQQRAELAAKTPLEQQQAASAVSQERAPDEPASGGPKEDLTTLELLDTAIAAAEKERAHLFQLVFSVRSNEQACA